MAAQKNNVLIVNSTDEEVELFSSRAEAQKYLDQLCADYPGDYDSDNIEAYEVTQKLCIEETTKLTISDDC